MNRLKLSFVAFLLLGICYQATAQGVVVSTDEYTREELVTSVLINNACNQAFNIESSSGNGIGYFTNGDPSSGIEPNADFPMEAGVILSTGNATAANGPNTSGSSGDWPGDQDLFEYMTGLGYDVSSYNNASILEFDFIPYTSNLSFDFIFVSDEYGTFQCNYSDAFAFFLTDTSTSTTTNLALVPNTNDPISVVTIRDQQYNSGCSSENIEYFDKYFGEGGLPANTAPHNFNGQTVKMTATSPVSPGTTYHIKLVVADRNDQAYDSAVFIEAGSFDIGNVDLPDLLIETGTALCEGEEFLASVEAIEFPGLYYTSYIWEKDGEIVEDESNEYLITEPGSYSITVDYYLETQPEPCTLTSEFIVEEYIFPDIAEPNDISQCPNLYDLTVNDTTVLGLEDGFHLSYYEDAALENLIENPTQYVRDEVDQTIYIKIEDPFYNCVEVKEFLLIAAGLDVQTDLPPVQSCAIDGTTATFDLTEIETSIYEGSDVTFLYFETQENANNNENNITNPTEYTGEDGQEIWVRVTDTNDPSCFAIVSFTLEFYQAFEIGLDPTYTICASSVVLGPSTEYASYLWSTDETTQTIEVDEVGEYTLTVTDENGCTATQTLTVEVGELELNTIENPVQACDEGGTGSFDLTIYQDDFYTGSNAVEVTYYTSMEDAENQVDDITDPTMFEGTNNQTIYVLVQVVGADCSGIGTMQLEFYPPFSLDLPEDYVICASTVELGPTQTYASYLWSTEETTQTITVSEPGVYTLTVTNDMGCTTSQSFNVTVGDLDILDSLDPIYACDEGEGTGTFDLTVYESIVFTGNTPIEITYHHTEADAQGDVDPIENINPYQGTNNEQIWVRVEVMGSPDCNNIVPFTLLFYDPFVVDADTNFSVCSGNSVTLGTNSSYASYLWSTEETTPTIEVDEVGTYDLTVTDENGCASTHTFIVEPGTSPTITQVIYGPGSVNLEAAGGVAPYEFSLEGYVWQSSGMFNNLPAGTYNFYVRGADGCLSNAFELAIFEIPTLFTPNGDGINDVWRIPGLELYPDSSVSIWDRYGKLVYEGTPTNSAIWNGNDMSGNKMPTQDYWYVLNVADGRQFKGHITVKRRKEKE